MSFRSNRRDFVKASSITAAGFWVAGGVKAADSVSANEKIQFACIGVGGKGSSDSGDAARSGDVVAICDIDDKTLNNAGQARYKEAKRYNDFRKMLEELGSKIDAVTVSTPDHTHAVASAMAMKMGKHCFTQKPMTHYIWEARRLADIAKEKKVATQMGNQGTANASLRAAAEVIKSGGVGDVTEVHVWTNRPIWPQGLDLDRPKDTPATPETVHWEEWVGPAPYRPYSPVYHPFRWRGWWDFGTGALGDMACHTLNMPYMALDLRDPIAVSAETSGHNKESYPKWSVIKYEFPALDKRPALTLYWYDGGKKPAEELFHGAKIDGSGALVVGKDGTLYAPGDYAEKGLQLLPKEKYATYKAPEPFIPRSKSGHFGEWVDAIRGGTPAMSNFPDYAGKLTETVLLGNLAVWAGKRVEWDAKNMKAKGMPELDALIKPQYREGYEV